MRQAPALLEPGLLSKTECGRLTVLLLARPEGGIRVQFFDVVRGMIAREDVYPGDDLDAAQRWSQTVVRDLLRTLRIGTRKRHSAHPSDGREQSGGF